MAADFMRVRVCPDVCGSMAWHDGMRARTERSAPMIIYPTRSEWPGAHRCPGDGGGSQRRRGGSCTQMRRTVGQVSFRKEARVGYYRLTGGFPARLPDDCVLILRRLAARRGSDGLR